MRANQKKRREPGFCLGSRRFFGNFPIDREDSGGLRHREGKRAALPRLALHADFAAHQRD